MTEGNGAAGAPVVAVRQLHKRFGALEVLKGVDLTVSHGETTVLIGPSGAGKSSLLRCVNFLELPSSGDIRVFGEQLCHTEEGRLHLAPDPVLRRARARMPMVFQHFNLFHHRTVLENVIEGPTHVQLKPKAQAIEEALTVLRRVGLLDKQDSYPDQLSGGQKQRVAIARALAMEPALILFDEPTSSLDPELVAEVLAIIRSLAEEGRTMIVVTHEMNFARNLADRVHFVVDGVITESGTPEEIFDAPRSPRLADFIQSVRGGATSRSGVQPP
jgi:ABC-type histidine transport system ATPase subunit